MDMRERPMVICRSDWEEIPYGMGKVLHLFDESALMQRVSPTGRWDGLMLFDPDDLNDIEKDSPDTRRLETLVALKGEVMPDPPVMLATGLDTILTHALNNHRLVAVELLGSGELDATGYVLCVTDELVEIEQYDIYGNSNGVEQFYRNIISRVFCGGEALEDIELLIAHNKQRQDQALAT